MSAIVQPLALGLSERPVRKPWLGPRWRRFLRRGLVALAVGIVLRIFVGEAALVPTSSMEGTILVGDHILVNKFAFGPEVPFTDWRLPRLRTVERGNIIAFHYPKDPTLNFLKRVIAVGGETVEIRDGVVYVNHIPQREPYVVHTEPVWKRLGENMKPMVVPAGRLFVLGDNRDNSDDSRFWGTVPAENVIGEPLMVLWSYDAPSKAWLNEDTAFKLQFYSSIATHFFARTRWRRTGTLL